MTTLTYDKRLQMQSKIWTKSNLVRRLIRLGVWVAVSNGETSLIRLRCCSMRLRVQDSLEFVRVKMSDSKL